ncbi:MAG TPA: hypothetical protein DEU95_14120, partial [Chloroflexi bacterium]|nr:hypothetical protein [Chloroflexota bacterium]
MASHRGPLCQLDGYISLTTCDDVGARNTHVSDRKVVGDVTRITRATTYLVGNPWKNWLFLRLDTDQPGLYGLGEGTLNAFGRTVETAIHELAPRYQGMDPFQVETIVQRMTRDL